MEYNIEKDRISEGYTVICGTDEAGRGPLAGPVCAAAVILPTGLDLPGLNDSKKLTAKKRELLFDMIINSAVSYGIAFADNHEIDEINILNASQLAMRRAVAMLDPKPDLTCKMVVGEHPDLVISLLNALLPFKTMEEEIQSV